MNIDIIIVLSILLSGFILFLMEYFTIDVTALIILATFFGLGYLTTNEAVSGFSNPAVITIGLLFILSSAIQKTGLLEYLVITINRLLRSSRKLGLAVYYLTISIASSLINNTAIVAIFMPVTIRLAHRYGLSPSKMLIPLSYAAILGGTLTLVGTSTNLLVNSIYLGYEGTMPLGMFEFLAPPIAYAITNWLVFVSLVYHTYKFGFYFNKAFKTALPKIILSSCIMLISLIFIKTITLEYFSYRNLTFLWLGAVILISGISYFACLKFLGILNKNFRINKFNN